MAWYIKINAMPGKASSGFSKKYNSGVPAVTKTFGGDTRIYCTCNNTLSKNSHTTVTGDLSLKYDTTYKKIYYRTNIIPTGGFRKKVAGCGLPVT
jgi:hypothetical protein